MVSTDLVSSAERSLPIPFHPIADIFPMMEATELNDLADDIRAHGLREPIKLYQEKVIDGRNRYVACERAKVDPTFETYDGDDPLAYVVSLNIQRRHLTTSQRAMVAARIANLQHGGDRRSVKEMNHPPLNQSQDEDQETNLSLENKVTQASAARMLNVGEMTVKYAATVVHQGTPNLVEKVERGEVAVSVASEIARVPQPQQQEIVARGPQEIMRAAAVIRAERQGQKAVRRQEREVKLAERTVAASKQVGNSLYNVIYADPPWRFEPYSRETGMDRAADNHYQTMTLDKIKALDIPAAKDCVLFLWATAPMLPEALATMQDWGFIYKTHCVWDKEQIGTGYWFRNAHELLLVGVRGNVPAPAMGTQSASVYQERSGKHSQKPVLFYEMIERMFPSALKLEMFARNARTGWDAWGNEVE